jgi:hypothetical protein
MLMAHEFWINQQSVKQISWEILYKHSLSYKHYDGNVRVTLRMKNHRRLHFKTSNFKTSHPWKSYVIYGILKF